MKILCVQTEAVWEDKAATHRRVVELLDKGNIARGSLVVLPEMFATGFSMNVGAVAEEMGGETQRFLAEQAVLRGVYMLGGVVTRGAGGAGGKGRNEAVMYSPEGREVVRYQKVHPFSYGGEAEHYEAGGEVVMAEVGGVKVSPFICYDLRFPEIFREAAVKRGAEVLVVIAAWPGAREGHWKALLTARAIENQAYVVGVNHCGRDAKVTYFGGSRIVDPKGQVIVEAGAEPGVIAAEVEAGVVEGWRREFPALRDARWMR